MAATAAYSRLTRGDALADFDLFAEATSRDRRPRRGRREQPREAR